MVRLMPQRSRCGATNNWRSWHAGMQAITSPMNVGLPPRYLMYNPRAGPAAQ